MQFGWDKKKRRANLAKHGIDFADLTLLFSGLTTTLLDDRDDYGEFCFITLGLLKRIVLTVAHTETDEVIRIISARKATRYEEESYFKKIRKCLEASFVHGSRCGGYVRYTRDLTGAVRSSRGQTRIEAGCLKSTADDTY
jgi:uncharacterized protein